MYYILFSKKLIKIYNNFIQIDEDDIKNHINTLSTYYSVGGGISGQSIDTIEKIYTSGIEGSEDLSSVQQTALLYLEAIISRNESYYKPIINEIVTGKKDGDYKSAIEGAQDSQEVKKLIETVKGELNRLGYAEHMHEQAGDPHWSMAPLGASDEEKKKYANSYWTRALASNNGAKEFNYVSGQGEKEAFTLPTSLTLKNENGEDVSITSDRISFGTRGSDALKVDKYGRVTYNSSLMPGTYTTTIVVKIDGIEVSSRDITVEVTSGKGAEKLKDEEDVKIKVGDAYYSVKDIIDPKQATSDKFMNVESLCNFTNPLGAAISNAKSKIASRITDFANNLIKAGYNQQLVNNAKTTTINYYNALLMQCEDLNADKGKTVEFEYVDANGTKHSASAKYDQKKKKGERHIKDDKSMIENDANGRYSGNSSGIQINLSSNSPRTYQIMINLSVLFQKFQTFMV